MIAYLHHHHLLSYLLTVLSATLIPLITIPSILHVAHTRNLYDDLGYFRKQHHHGIPRLGGIAIFVSFTITLLLFGIADEVLPINYLLTSCIMLFAMGIKDDLSGVNPGTKFFIQFMTALILVLPGDIRLSSLYGVFGIYELSYFVSVLLSVLTIMFIINAFNLIDGIDGLAATTGIIVNGVFSALFMYMKQYELATVSLALAGAIIGFLKFNITPAKIFMGDTGSLLIGLICAVMAIAFMEANQFNEGETTQIPSAPAIAVAILIGPIADTLRVFTVRILNGSSPFKADRNHIHHRMLKLGFNHLQTTFILTTANALTISLAFILSDYGNEAIILSVALISMTSNWILTYLIRSKERESYKLRNLFA